MTRRYIPFLLVLTLGIVALIALPGPSAPRPPLAPALSRTFEFVYQVHVPPSQNAMGPLRLWIPLPADDGYQDVHSLHVDSPAAYSQGHDPEYKDRYAMFTPTAGQAAAGFDVTMRFVATRREHRVTLDSDSRGASADGSTDPADPLLPRYLEPDKLVPLNGTIAELAKEHTVGDTTPLEKSRHIYDYVVSTMRYDKSGEGWGRGDAIWACTSKRGNCTDFHSLFIGMMRASGIPARFEIGFPLPEDKSEGEISGYHCWAEFYLNGIGWVPVDASEAWKNPAKHDYFFGAHDVNRVFFTYGRDIKLSPEQKSAPLNYFIYPYAEANGQPVRGLQTHFSFRDVSPSATRSSTLTLPRAPRSIPSGILTFHPLASSAAFATVSFVKFVPLFRWRYPEARSTCPSTRGYEPC
ncbi:MAG TPA: transglutaminase domain-containing protein [Candidatus Methylomirabilis sp.]|nr:transglutaminase domain-containing protein [Candidatus Methylomirabilis sp.]